MECILVSYAKYVLDAKYEFMENLFLRGFTLS
jgi:hypothetical protein